MNPQAVLLAGIVAALASAQTPGHLTYHDPQNRFHFQYPATFGETSPGTNDGFGDRVASIRFARFSSGVQGNAIVLGGEAALTQGFPMIDLQAAGGLYDSIMAEIFPSSLRQLLMKNLPRLTAANFCDAIGRERHIAESSPALAGLTPTLRKTLLEVDATRNFNPKVLSCVVQSDTVTFDKEVSFNAGGPRQRVHGAVRFLPPPYSTIQIVRATAAAPTPEMLRQITQLLLSWKGN